MQDLFTPRAHFQAFGFVALRGALSHDEATALAIEADRSIRDAIGCHVPAFVRARPAGNLGNATIADVDVRGSPQLL